MCFLKQLCFLVSITAPCVAILLFKRHITDLYTVSYSWYSSLLWTDSHRSNGRHTAHFESPHSDPYCTHTPLL